MVLVVVAVVVVVVVVVGGVMLVVLVVARVGKGTSPKATWKMLIMRSASAGITHTTGTTLAPYDDKRYLQDDVEPNIKIREEWVSGRGRPVIPEGIRLATKGLRPGEGLVARIDSW